MGWGLNVKKVRVRLGKVITVVQDVYLKRVSKDIQHETDEAWDDIEFCRKKLMAMCVASPYANDEGVDWVNYVMREFDEITEMYEDAVFKHRVLLQAEEDNYAEE